MLYQRIVEANIVKSNLAQKRTKKAGYETRIQTLEGSLVVIFKFESSDFGRHPLIVVIVKTEPFGFFTFCHAKLQKRKEKMLIVKTKFENTMKHGNRMVKVERLFYWFLYKAAHHMLSRKKQSSKFSHIF